MTKLLYRLLQEHKAAHIHRLLNIGTFNQENLGEISEIKGYINTLEMILDTEQFFEGEQLDEEIQTN